MKKFIILFAILFAFAAVNINAQTATVIPYKLSALTLNGTGADTVTFPSVQGEYDVSLQLLPALSGSGDSLDFTYYLYQSNHDYDNAWTIIGGQYTVSDTADADMLISITDFKGLRLRSICTGVSTDTATVTPYMVVKKHAQE